MPYSNLETGPYRSCWYYCCNYALHEFSSLYPLQYLPELGQFHPWTVIVTQIWKILDSPLKWPPYIALQNDDPLLCLYDVNLTVWRELVLREISAFVTHFFRLFDVVNNPFTQRKDSYSLSPIDGDSFNSSDIYWWIGFVHTVKLIRTQTTLGVLLLEAGLERRSLL